MTLDLSGVTAKVGRAAHHLKTLQTALDDFMSIDRNGVGPGIRLQFDEQGGTWKAITDIPDEIPVEPHRPLTYCSV